MLLVTMALDILAVCSLLIVLYTLTVDHPERNTCWPPRICWVFLNQPTWTLFFTVLPVMYELNTQKGGGLWNPEYSLNMWEDTSELVLRINEIWWNLWQWSADNTARKTLNRDHILWEGARRDSTPNGRMKEALLRRWHWSLVMKTSAGGDGSKVGGNIQHRYNKGKSMGICHWSTHT